MAVVKKKPTSPGRRFVVQVSDASLHKGAPHRALLEAQGRHGGRNNSGRITVRHQGGGHRQHYRVIDFKRAKDGIPARVERLEYDPNRTAHIALLLYRDGERRYVIASRNMKAGDELLSGEAAPIKEGNTLPLRNIPLGSVVHCIEMKPGKGAQTRTQRRSRRAVGGPRGAVCDVASALRRDAQGPGRLPRDTGRSIECREQPAFARQGRREALARSASNGTRRRDEPGRSPAWWW
jgi:hypothetical protein